MNLDIRVAYSVHAARDPVRDDRSITPSRLGEP
jgi:hypothetical protein